MMLNFKMLLDMIHFIAGLVCACHARFPFLAPRITLVAHILACLWFAIGQAVSETRQAARPEQGSWIDIAGINPQRFDVDAAPVGGVVQYLHSIAWILLPPAPPELAPDSWIEYLFAVLLFVTTVLVIGSALSILTGTLQEIRQVNNERSRKRRELRIFLQTKAVPTERPGPSRFMWLI